MCVRVSVCVHVSDLALGLSARLSDVWLQMHGPIDHKIAVCVSGTCSVGRASQLTFH